LACAGQGPSARDDKGQLGWQLFAAPLEWRLVVAKKWQAAMVEKIWRAEPGRRER
jgi:hypothetical protein